MFFSHRSVAEKQSRLYYTLHLKEYAMQLTPLVQAQYVIEVKKLLTEILQLDEDEFNAQEKLWCQTVKTWCHDAQEYWEEFLASSVQDGYHARWISILLAPNEALRPYVWPTGITIPEKTAEDLLTLLKEKGNADRLQRFIIKLRELNASLDVTHAS